MTEKSIMMLMREFQSNNTIRITSQEGPVSIKQYRTLIHIMDKVQDQRVKGRTSYTLSSLLAMVFISVLSGADSFSHMQVFWEAHSKAYRRIFGYDTIPSHDTFRRIMGLVSGDDFNGVIVECLKGIDKSLRKALKLKSSGKKHLCVDGKRLRGTGREATDKGPIKDLQILNVYDCGSDTCICSEPIEDKTNEIPHAQKILGKMNLRDTVVSFDAMNTQKGTINVIAERRGDFIGGLKGNHPTLNKWAEDIFTKECRDSMRGNSDIYWEQKEISHNQLECRRYYLYRMTGKESNDIFPDWKKVRSIVCFEKITRNNVSGRKAVEIRYYITSLTDITDISTCIREHWSIENRLHNGLDTVLNEDEMTASNRTAALNRSIVNKMCLAIYRRLQDFMDPKKRYSKKLIRLCLSWDFEKWMKFILTALDPESLKKCLVIEKKTKQNNTSKTE